MAENYNDAGRRVKQATKMHKRSDTSRNIGDEQIKSADESQAKYEKIMKHLNDNPELHSLLKDMRHHIMFEDVLGGKYDPKTATDISPEGRDDGKEYKVRSTDDLRKMRKILSGEDE